MSSRHGMTWEQYTAAGVARLYAPKGVDVARAVLNDDAVREIRRIAKEREALAEQLRESSNAALAARFGVDRRAIAKVINYTNWAHVRD